MVSLLHVSSSLPQGHAALWHAAGLTDEPVAVHLNALPADLFAEAQKDALEFSRVVRSDGAKYKFGKLPTNWLPLRADRDWDPPRSALEAAVQQLHKVAFGGEAAGWLAGAEWWLNQNEVASLHFDKDEALVSDENRIAFPAVSTVT